MKDHSRSCIVCHDLSLCSARLFFYAAPVLTSVLTPNGPTTGQATMTIFGINFPVLNSNTASRRRQVVATPVFQSSPSSFIGGVTSRADQSTCRDLTLSEVLQVSSTLSGGCRYNTPSVSVPCMHAHVRMLIDLCINTCA